MILTERYKPKIDKKILRYLEKIIKIKMIGPRVIGIGSEGNINFIGHLVAELSLQKDSCKMNIAIAHYGVQILYTTENMDFACLCAIIDMLNFGKPTILCKAIKDDRMMIDLEWFRKNLPKKIVLERIAFIVNEIGKDIKIEEITIKELEERAKNYLIKRGFIEVEE